MLFVYQVCFGINLFFFKSNNKDLSLILYTFSLNIRVKKGNWTTEQAHWPPIPRVVQLLTLEAWLKGIWNENKHLQAFSHPSRAMFFKFLWLYRCIFFLPEFLNTPEQMWPSVVFVSSATKEGENSLPRLRTDPRCQRRVNAVWKVAKRRDNTLRGGPAESLSSGGV